jgi:hypothetical protein
MTTPADNLWAAERCERDAMHLDGMIEKNHRHFSDYDFTAPRNLVASLRERAERFRAAAQMETAP